MKKRHQGGDTSLMPFFLLCLIQNNIHKNSYFLVHFYTKKRLNNVQKNSYS
jgi:hypothetical protein